MKTIVVVSLAFLLPVVTSCAATSMRQPTVFPNEHYQRVGSVRAQADMRDCMELAKHYSDDKDIYIEAAKSGAIGAGVGAGTGAIAGTIMKGKVGRATAAGAAVGSIVGIASELTKAGDPSPSYQRFVEHCLERQGYEVVGWR